MANYKIRFKQGENEFEVEGDRAYVTKIYNELKGVFGMTTTARPVLVGGLKSGRTSSADRALPKMASPREFIDRYNLRRHVDIVLGFGYFVEKYRNLKSFSAVDISTCYYEAKMEPSNTSQMIINNIKKGFLMQSQKSGSKRTYTLTRTGEQFVESGFTRAKS